MFVTNEWDHAYRNGDSGPKYLLRGPKMNFALMRIKPGQDFAAHYHRVMEENFYILRGEVDIVVDGEAQRLKAGQLLHLEPGEVHYIRNAGSEDAEMLAMLAPGQENDKVEVENPAF